MNHNKRNRCEIARRPINPEVKSTPIQFKGKKRYQLARKRNSKGRQQKDNLNLEVSYFNVLSRAKRLWKDSEKLAFERDYRNDRSDGFYLAMYAFMTDSFYLYLECEFDYCYSLEFAFCNCKYEIELRELLTPLKSCYRVKEVHLKPDFQSYFKNVLAFQPERFRYFL